MFSFFFFQAEDGIRDSSVTGVQTCALPILIVDAYALNGSPSGQRREDFTSDEMKEGKVLYFEQIDNLCGKAVYRLHIGETSASRLVFAIENVSTIRDFFVPGLHPGDYKSRS